MLKRFFISLIILSTIAAEGVINFPGNIYNFLTCLNSDAGQNINLKEKVEPSKKSDESNGIFCGTFSLTMNSFQKLGSEIGGKYLNKYKISIDNEDKFDYKFILSSYKVAPKATLKTNKKLVLFRTDTSPPLM